MAKDNTPRKANGEALRADEVADGLYLTAAQEAAEQTAQEAAQQQSE